MGIFLFSFKVVLIQQVLWLRLVIKVYEFISLLCLGGIRHCPKAYKGIIWPI